MSDENNVDVHIRGRVDASLKGAAGEAKNTLGDLKDAVVDNAAQMTGVNRDLLAGVTNLAPRFLLVGGAVATMAKAYADGVAEVKAMNLAIGLGGDISGQTASSLRELSADMASHSRMTIAESKTIASALASSGQIGAGAFEKVGRVAGDFARVMGTDVARVGPELVKLFDDPARGAEELNRRMHFLSAAELDRIEHLTRTGEVTQAQIELAGKLGERMDEIVPKLGYVERAWDGVRGAASKAWDAMMGLGREQTTKDRLDAVYIRIKNVEAMGAGARNLPADKQVPALMREALKLQDELEAESQKKFDKSQVAEKSRQEQEDRALANRLSRSQRAAAIDDQIARMKKSSVAGAAEAVAELEKQRADLFKEKKVPKSELEKMLERGQKNEMDAYYETGGEETMRLVAEKRSLTSAREAAVRELEQRQAAARLTHGLSADYRKTDEARDRADEADRMTESQRRLAAALDAVDDKARATREALDLKFPERERESAAYHQAVKDIEEAQKGAAQSAAEWAARQDQLNQSWEYGADKALRSYLDEIQNVAKESERFMDGMLRNAEDVFVQIGKTGRIEIGSLTAFIRGEMARAVYRESFAPAVASGAKWLSSQIGGLLGASDKFSAADFAAERAAIIDQHSGGIAGSGEGSAVKLRPLSLFSNAHRYHGGGLAGDEVPTVLQRGEGVFTKGQMKALGVKAGAGNVSVVVNNTAAPETTATATARPNNGGFEVEVLVQRAIARDMARNGPITQGLGSMFGLQRGG